MAGLEGYQKRAAVWVRSVCAKARCHYGGYSGDGICRVKYPDQVIEDFETDGCSVAAQQTESPEYGVVPIHVSRDGTVTVLGGIISNEDHRDGLKGSEGKVVYQAVSE